MVGNCSGEGREPCGIQARTGNRASQGAGASTGAWWRVVAAFILALGGGPGGCELSDACVFVSPA